MTPRLQLPPIPPGIRMLTTDQSRSLDRRTKMTGFSAKNCITCRGRKTFLWRGADGEPAEYDCPCADQYLMHRSLLNSGVMLGYQRLGWGDYEHMTDSVMTEVAQFLTHREAYLDAGFGIVLHGSRGNGKTLLANLIVKEMVGDGINCYVTTFADMVDAFAGGWRDAEQEKWFNQIVRNAQVLYIDDVGREYVADRFRDAKLTDDQKRTAAAADNRPGSVKETLLEAVIRHRVGNSLPTFFSTNFTPEEISTGYGGHTMSLLGEKSKFVRVDGIDRRPEMRGREERYLLAGMTRPIVIDRAVG